MTDVHGPMTGYDGLMTDRPSSKPLGINRMSALMTDMTDFSPFSSLLLFSTPSCLFLFYARVREKQEKIRHIRHWSAYLTANTMVMTMTDSAQSVMTRHQPVMGGELWTLRPFWTD
jgi:hypothetical protein